MTCRLIVKGFILIEQRQDSQNEEKKSFLKWHSQILASNTATCDDLDFEYDAIKLPNSAVDGLNQGYRDGGTNKTTGPANRAEGQGVPR